MNLDQNFERLTGLIARHQAEIDEASADLAMTARLLGSAEYELAQLKRSLDGFLGSDRRAILPLPAAIAGPADSRAFCGKLRAQVHPSDASAPTADPAPVTELQSAA